MNNTQTLSREEQFAEQNSEQYLGCTLCKRSHHITSFCRSCGRCFYTAAYFNNIELGDFVTCKCGQVDLWD